MRCRPCQLPAYAIRGQNNIHAPKNLVKLRVVIAAVMLYAHQIWICGDSEVARDRAHIATSRGTGIVLIPPLEADTCYFTSIGDRRIDIKWFNGLFV